MKKIILNNKKARFDYEFKYTIEAGISLQGDEVKSLRQGKGSLNGAYAVAKAGELWLINCSIPVYDNAYQKDEDRATRSRKLLLHKKQINKILGDASQKGVAILPLKVYFNEKNLIKVELGVGTHRKVAGKKQLLKERDIARETKRALKNYQ